MTTFAGTIRSTGTGTISGAGAIRGTMTTGTGRTGIAVRAAADAATAIQDGTAAGVSTVAMDTATHMWAP